MNALPDLAALDSDLRGIRDVSPDMLQELLSITAGSISERLAGLQAWRESLLQGQSPPSCAWPGEDISQPVRRALTSLDLVRFLRDQRELVDELLLDIVRAFARGEVDLNKAILAELARLERAEAERAGDQEPSPKRELEAEARATTLACWDAQADAELVSAWAERARAWAQMADVFGELGDMLGLGWNLARRALQHRGWRELAALRKLIAALPQLSELVEILGRLRAKNDGPPLTEIVVETMVREVDRKVAIVTPGVPPEIRGVERSGEIARMLPVEAAYLGHPTLRLLWHARRAERALLSYAVEGVLYGRETITEVGEKTVERPKPPLDKGPMVVCLDTSGSMAGAREAVAKALVLEVMRTALREKRRAFVYLFSGPGDVAELELDLNDRGLARLLDFVAQSFHGGTDVDAPLRAALERLRKAEWKEADVLLVSDGEFPVGDQLVRDIGAARATLSARFHGLLVGGHSQAMASLCDQVHRFTQWNAVHG